LPLTHLIVLALIQGLTEFLPISSSGHLVMVPHILSWPDQGLIIDVAVHMGSLLAVIIYLWRDLWGITLSILKFRNSREKADLSLIKMILIASIPVMLMGLGVSLVIDSLTRSIEVIGWATLIFGLLLGLSDRMGMTINELGHMGFLDALLIGVSQALALIPGASRSGLTITMARFLGYDRGAAARFSLLLSIPAILGASFLKGIEVVMSDNMVLSLDVLIATVVSFLAAVVSIALMMAWLSRSGFMPFVFYRIILGAGLLTWVYL
jgi:undecaprenyl-diphosphatase